MAASSPRDVELRFQQIQNVVQAPVSARWALRQVAEFLAQIDVERPGVESYLLPLVEPVATRASDLDPVGLHPDTICSLAEQLERARQRHPALAEMEQMEEAERALRRRAALLYAYAGAMDRAVDCLHPEVENRFTVEGLADSTPRERFEEVRTEDRSSDVDRPFRWMAAHWDRAGDGGHVSFVPVVEQSPAWMNGGRWEAGGVGALHRIGVELYGPSDTTDRLQVDMVAHGADEADLAAVPLRAARQLLEERHPRLQERYVQGRLAFDYSHLQHQGQSAGLAVAALFYGAMLDYTRRRSRRQLRSKLAITGSIAADGTVRPVDENTLPVKVRTAFFSPKTMLVVPEAQQATAEEVRASLIDDYPHGELTVVGVDRLEALFFDRRLTKEEHVGWARHLGRRVWDQRERVVMGAFIAALLLLIGLLWYGPVDKNPVQARFSGETMFVQNANGRTIEEIEVGEHIVGQVEGGQIQRPVAFEDVTGDGTNEIIWEAAVDGSGNHKVLRARSVGADTLLWEKALQFDIRFPRKPAVVSPNYHVEDLLVGNLDGAGGPDVYAALVHETYFPGLLLRLDARTGAERQRYVHPGHFNTQLTAGDLDRDQVQEVLVGGYSNAFSDPTLIVLDPTSLQGHAPTTREYAVSGLEPAAHHAYLRFPASAVQETAPAGLQMVDGVKVKRESRLVWVEVRDGRHEAESINPYLIVHLDYELRPVAVGTSSGYDHLAEQLVQEGRLDAVPAPEDFQRYREQIGYWTGEGWVHSASQTGPTGSVEH